jgi:transketolase
LASAVNLGLGEITVIVDHNKIQSDTWVDQVSDLGDLEAKIRTFGWEVGRCDGNDVAAFARTLVALEGTAGSRRPKLLVADTLKGAGVSFMEPQGLERSAAALYGFHSGAPSVDEYERALAELVDRLSAMVEVELVEAPTPPRAAPPAAPQRLVPAYGAALAAVAAEELRLVALDADLVLDTGLIPFRDRFPERFYECGIAEQDMVSQAGAMALSGLIPVCHSFACFLSTRPNEQIYNNCTEDTKVIYVGSLAGLVPGGPGHSHQSVRDISALSAMPEMALVEPYCEAEVEQVVRWAVHEAPGSVYIRLVSVPWDLGFEPRVADEFVPRRGTVLREGVDGWFVTTGPVMVAQAWAAADLLASRGVTFGVIALPWLRDVDGEWLAEAVGDAPIVTLDNHYVSGGQGDAVRAALGGEATRLGVERVPECGTNAEVLRAHGLDSQGLVASVARTNNAYA